jgi:hypothetical protein
MLVRPSILPIKRWVRGIKKYPLTNMFSFEQSLYRSSHKIVENLLTAPPEIANVIRYN